MGQHELPQVKICGLTKVEEAIGCAQLGAAAIGLVFYPKSPRHLADDEAKRIGLALPAHVAKVGVFVNEDYAFIRQKIDACGLTGVQLHGREPADLVERLTTDGVAVYKALFMTRQPGLDAVKNYQPKAFLVECGKGKLPGGNAETWNWAEARPVAKRAPLIVAGGLAPDNIQAAVTACRPDAVDLSSGVESSPGRKNLDLVARLFENLAALKGSHSPEREMREVF